MASSEYLSSHDPIQNLESCDWLGWGNANNHLKWPEKRKFPTIPVRGDMYSDVLQLAAIQEHMGIASLPCFMGDSAPGIQRLSKAGIVPGEWVWVLAHKDMAKNAKVRALIDFLSKEFPAHKNRMEGKS